MKYYFIKSTYKRENVGENQFPKKYLNAGMKEKIHTTTPTK